MVWSPDIPQENEASKIKYEIVQYTRGRGLDLGCGKYKLYPHFIGVDNGHHWGSHGIDIVADCEDLSIFADGVLDFVFSSHLLEHIKDAAAALKEWWRVLAVGGHLVLYLPHKDFYPNIGEEGANPDHEHDFTPDDIIGYMKGLKGWDLLVNEERSGGMEYSFLQVYRKRNDHKHNQAWRRKRPAKTCAVVRYGGFGDMIQASSVLPGLKEQGYHVTVFTTPKGRDILRADPHVDEFFIQDTDQVPNHELGRFWEVQRAKYDKFINLSESVEGTLLALPGRVAHQWPDEVRRKMLNVNYLEFTHDLAGVPFPPRQRFYPTPEEKRWADRERRKIGGTIILWVLSGSSVHKAWPYLDQALARIMLQHPEVNVVLVGDEMSQLLECGWENESRVLCRSGKWSIRESLSFARVADMVIGPETGIMNAVGLLPVPKIITLSHSSQENLTKHWKNCTALTPEDCPCYPCHMMHYGYEFCTRDSHSGVAMCQARISVEQMTFAINKYLVSAEEVA